MSDYLYAANTRLMSNEEEGALENAAMQLPYTHVMEELAAHEIMGLVERTIDSMADATNFYSSLKERLFSQRNCRTTSNKRKCCERALQSGHVLGP